MLSFARRAGRLLAIHPSPLDVQAPGQAEEPQLDGPELPTGFIASSCASAFSLNGWGLSTPFVVGLRNAHFSFGARRAPSRIRAVPASQFACGPSGGQKAAGACRDRIVARAAGLEGLFAAEHVPAGDQHLAGDRR